MKFLPKAIAVVFMAVVFTYLTTSVFAGGDKVRGDEGDGAVVQNQVSDLPYENRP